MARKIGYVMGRKDGRLIKAENERRNGRLQVAMRR